jgi:hypothetical protein
MNNIELIGAWISVLFTLSILSYLYKDNPFYKSAEHVFVGVSAGYWTSTFFWTQVYPNLFGRLWPASQMNNSDSFLLTLWYLPYHLIRNLTTLFGLTENNVFPVTGIESGFEEISFSYVIPLFLGLFMLMRLIKKLSWLARWAIAYTVGMAAGLRFFGYLSSDIIEQIRGSTIDLSAGPIEIINSLILIFGTLTGLLYFFFSRKDTGLISKFSKIGVYFLMISFGASFGFAVMGRISLLIGRFNSLIEYNGKEYHYSSLWILVFMIVTLAYWAFKNNNKQESVN